MEALRDVIANHEAIKKAKSEQVHEKNQQELQAKIDVSNHINRVAKTYLQQVQQEFKKKYGCRVEQKSPFVPLQIHFNDKLASQVAPILSFGYGGSPNQIEVTWAKRPPVNTAIELKVVVVWRCTTKDFTSEVVVREVNRFVEWVLEGKSINDVVPFN